MDSLRTMVMLVHFRSRSIRCCHFDCEKRKVILHSKRCFVSHLLRLCVVSVSIVFLPLPIVARSTTAQLSAGIRTLIPSRLFAAVAVGEVVAVLVAAHVVSTRYLAPALLADISNLSGAQILVTFQVGSRILNFNG
jgi:hypothetical protein